MNSSSTLSTNFSKNDDEIKFEFGKTSHKFMMAQEKWRKNFSSSIIQAVFRGYYYRNYLFKKINNTSREKSNNFFSQTFPKYNDNELENDFFYKKISDSTFNLKKSEKSKIKEIRISFSKKNNFL